MSPYKKIEMKLRHTVFILIGVLLASVCLQAAAIKIGSVAPSRSPWDKALNELAADWEKISNGTVQIKIFPGGIAGTEMDMLRKMRLGTIGGAVFSNMGLNNIIPDVFVLNTPFLMNSDEEFQYVFDKLKPVFEKQFLEKGYRVLFWSMAGWVHIFAKDKVVYPDDLKKHVVSVSPDEPDMDQVWKKMGYQIVPSDLKGLMIALQSGMVTAYYLPPLLSGSGQYFALAPHMLRLRMAPLVGGLVLTEKTWQSIPEEYRQSMLGSILKTADGLYERTVGLEREAVETMKENGLVIHEPPADALDKWKAAASAGMGELVGKAFSKEIYEQVLSLIQEFRRKRGG